MKKILIAGSSGYYNKDFVFKYLDAILGAKQIDYLIATNLGGAVQDSITWARNNKIEHIIYFKAQDIFEFEQDISCCIVFPYMVGNNTELIVKMSKEKNIPIINAPIEATKCTDYQGSL